ncbi:MAG: aspartate/glutamate racemase family protein [bacterium]|nr:aspartate/glutamate racemase family protein [Rhodospirillaceae bacterium]MDE0046072.1 aspartate/glutamate racemase family protein [bacterium]
MMEQIRICATIPVRGGLEAWGDVHRELLAPLARPGVEIVLWDLPEAPIEAIGNAYDCELVAMHHIRAAKRAEEEGFHAVAMGCLDEPGVQGAKEALSIPVTGESEACMHYASMVGRRFSFLMPGEINGNQRGGYGSRCIEDVARTYGFADKLASVRSVSGKTLEFAARDDSLPEAMIEQAHLAMEEDGADVVIGYGSLDVIGRLQRELPIPVIDPVQASAMMAESLARLSIAQSKRAYPRPANVDVDG